MEIELSLVMDRIYSSADFLPYLKKIHKFLIQTSLLGKNFSNYYLQVNDIDESTTYKISQNFEHFFQCLPLKAGYPVKKMISIFWVCGTEIWIF